MESQEKHNIEWKSVWKDEYLVGICAFANAQGGKFFIGISQLPAAVGQERGPSSLGKSEGLFGAGVYGHFSREDRHLVLTEL